MGFIYTNLVIPHLGVSQQVGICAPKLSNLLRGKFSFVYLKSVVQMHGYSSCLDAFLSSPKVEERNFMRIGTLKLLIQYQDNSPKKDADTFMKKELQFEA